MTFEVIKAEDGRFRWRLRDADGSVVDLPRPGKMALPVSTRAQRRRSDAGVQQALAQHFEAQRRGGDIAG